MARRAGITSGREANEVGVLAVFDENPPHAVLPQAGEFVGKLWIEVRIGVAGQQALEQWASARVGRDVFKMNRADDALPGIGTRERDLARQVVLGENEQVATREAAADPLETAGASGAGNHAEDGGDDAGCALVLRSSEAHGEITAFR